MAQQEKDPAAALVYTASENPLFLDKYSTPLPLSQEKDHVVHAPNKNPLFRDDKYVTPISSSSSSSPTNQVLEKDISNISLNSNNPFQATLSDSSSIPTTTPPQSGLYESTSSITGSISLSTSTSSRSLARQNSKSKIFLVHPSIQSPSYASKLGDIRYVTILYNPASGNRRGEKVMQQVVAKFEAKGLEVTTIQLLRPGHATEICLSRTDFEDMDVLCVIGGDGTFHEVVNGLMRHPIAHVAPTALPVLSVIPAGTGNSMVRELQGISSVRLSSDELLFGTTVAIDILKVTILSVQSDPPTDTVPDQLPHDQNEDCDQALANEHMRLKAVAGKAFVKKEVIYAFNSIHWGLASRVLERAEKMRWMGHGIRYTAASVMEMLAGTSTHARVVLEDERGVVTTYENDTFCLLIANNISTAGKGMKMAPKAKINDGLVDVLLIRSHKPWHLMKIFERFYSGTHIDLPYVEYKQVRKFSIFPYKKPGELEVQANPQFAEELVDIDGELKGCTPFECEVIPHALELII